jgi:hypothetical protein
VYRLSVVIVSYNCAPLLAACLDSLEQVEDVDLRVIVVDNASSDSTRALLRSRYPWVRSIALDANVGFAAANNVGLAEIDTEYVLLLNPDTVVPRLGLRSALDAMSRSPRVGMIGCKLVRPDGSLDHACKRGFPTPLGALMYFLKLHRLFPRSATATSYVGGAQPADEPGFVDAVNGAFMLVRKRARDEVGMLDERFWMYGEDLDWCFRFWKAGWLVLYWPELTVVHVKGGSSTSARSWRVNRAFHEAMWLFYAKHQAARSRRVTRCAIRFAIYAKLGLSAVRGGARRVGGAHPVDPSPELPAASASR